MFFAIAPVGGAVLLGLHGIHRGIAHAVLELQDKAGIVRHVVDRVIDRLESSEPSRTSFEERVRTVVQEYVESTDLEEGGGLSRSMLRRVKRRVAVPVRTRLLAAFRSDAATTPLATVAEPIASEIAATLKRSVRRSLNKQLAVLLIAQAVIGVCWPYLLKALAVWIGTLS